jgi:hypothetical protein
MVHSISANSASYLSLQESEQDAKQVTIAPGDYLQVGDCTLFVNGTQRELTISIEKRIADYGIVISTPEGYTINDSLPLETDGEKVRTVKMIIASDENAGPVMRILLAMYGPQLHIASISAEGTETEKLFRNSSVQSLTFNKQNEVKMVNSSLSISNVNNVSLQVNEQGSLPVKTAPGTITQVGDFTVVNGTGRDCEISIEKNASNYEIKITTSDGYTLNHSLPLDFNIDKAYNIYLNQNTKELTLRPMGDFEVIAYDNAVKATDAQNVQNTQPEKIACRHRRPHRHDANAQNQPEKIGGRHHHRRHRQAERTLKVASRLA